MKRQEARLRITVPSAALQPQWAIAVLQAAVSAPLPDSLVVATVFQKGVKGGITLYLR